MSADPTFDIAVIGAGAAGLFASLAARGALAADGAFRRPASDVPRVVLLDGQARPGRKILISGGGRCNVTNRHVERDDYMSAKPNIVRNVLREFPVEKVIAFFASRGVELVEEPLGKLFPRSDRAKDVLAALLDAADEAGVATRFGAAVTSVEAIDGGFRLNDGPSDGLTARAVALATGGLSVPKTGSTGFGLDLARSLGHTLVAPVPALTPLLTAPGLDCPGVTVPVTLFAEDADGRRLAASTGSLLFTHQGVTGPAALDLSGALERAWAEGTRPRVFVDLWGPAGRDSEFGAYLRGPKLPGACLRPAMRPTDPAELERELADAASRTGRTALGTFLLARLPRRLVAQLVDAPGTELASLTKEHRRQAARAVCRMPLDVTGSAGFAKAEVTTGGVDLAEVQRRTLESRLVPGLFLCGEVLDATGRLGGFNFQWAWSSGYLAGRGAAAAIPG